MMAFIWGFVYVVGGIYLGLVCLNIVLGVTVTAIAGLCRAWRNDW